MRFDSVFGLALALALTFSATSFVANAESAPSANSTASKCLKDVQGFDEELTRRGFGVMRPGSLSPTSGYYDFPDTPWQRMRAYGRAARAYALEGDGRSCEQLLASMRKIYQDHKDLVGPEADNPNTRIAWRRAHLANARPVTEMKRLMRADLVIGANVRNSTDEHLGDIQDVVFDPERRTIAYVLVSRGGFLGVGQKWIAVRWTDLRATDDHGTYVLDVSPRALDRAPAIDHANFAKTADVEWQRKLAQYWDDVIKK